MARDLVKTLREPGIEKLRRNSECKYQETLARIRELVQVVCETKRPALVRLNQILACGFIVPGG